MKYRIFITLLLTTIAMQCMAERGYKTVTGTSDGFMILKDDGTLWKWDKVNAPDSRPQQVADNVAEVCSNGHTILMIDRNNTLWEMSIYNTLDANDKKLPPYTPREVMKDVRQAAVGASHGLAIKTDGSLWGWGSDHWAELANVNNGNYVATPMKIMDGVQQAAAGYQYSMALLQDGTLLTWGYNGEGQLGDGSQKDRKKPVNVKLPLQVKKIFCGDRQSMAILADGSLWGWGEVSNLVGAKSGIVKKPAKIMDSVRAINIQVYDGHNGTIVCNDGTLLAWGNNSNGALGDGTTQYRATPVKVADAVIMAAVGGWKGNKQIPSDLHILYITENGDLMVTGSAPQRKRK